VHLENTREERSTGTPEDPACRERKEGADPPLRKGMEKERSWPWAGCQKGGACPMEGITSSEKVLDLHRVGERKKKK